MSSPGIRPQNNKPAAGPAGKKGPPQTLRRALGGRRRTDHGAEHCHAPGKDRTLGTAGRRRLAVRAAARISNHRATERKSRIVRARRGCATPGRIGGRARRTSGARRARSSPRAQAAGGGLAAVIAAWPALPRNIRAAILAMIRETSPGDA